MNFFYLRKATCWGTWAWSASDLIRSHSFLDLAGHELPLLCRICTRCQSALWQLELLDDDYHLDCGHGWLCLGCFFLLAIEYLFLPEDSSSFLNLVMNDLVTFKNWDNGWCWVYISCVRLKAVILRLF